MWFFYALASALFASVRRTNEKRIAQTLSNFTVGWTVQGLSLPVIGLITLLHGQFLNPLHVSLRFWLILPLIWFVYYPLNTYCYVNAYRSGEFSKILPLQSLGPVLSLLTGFLAFRQRPTSLGIVAIILVVVGVYVLNMKGKRLHNPVHMFTADKPNLYMLGVIVLNALVDMLDVLETRATNPLYYGLMSTLGAAPTLFMVARFMGERDSPKIRKQYKGLLLAGTLFALSYGTFLAAIASGPIAYVSAVRSSSMFMGAAIGIIWLKERFNRQKLAAFILMAAGLLLLAGTS